MTDCSKYKEWIKDAALGALAPKQERDLLAHAGECDTCREAYRHAREVADFVERGIESLVSGEPSPEFAVRLRARIAQERPPARLAWLSLKSVATAAAALAILAILVAVHDRRHSQTVSLNVPPAATDARLVNPASTGSARNASAAQPRLPAYARVHRGHSIQGRATSQPEVLVPPGQFAAVMQLAKAIQSGEINGKELLAAEQRTDAPLKIDPIQITPLEPQTGRPPEAPQTPSH